jgi:hypothetical protein
MAIREIGQYRDAHLELETLVRKAGPVLETFVQERIRLDGPQFTQVGPDLRHKETGQTIEEFYAPGELRKRSPHGFADWAPDQTHEQRDALAGIIENACLHPSPASLAALWKALKSDADKGRRYYNTLREWGVDAAKMLPGQRPGYVYPAKKSGGDGASNNPWSPNWSGTPEAALAEQARILKVMGTKGAASMARAAGVSVFGAKLA